MAKEKLITRTISVSTIEATFLDIETAEVRKVDIDIPEIGNIRNPHAYIESNYAILTEKLVTFKFLKTEFRLYGITLQHFLENAELLNIMEG
nr:MAG TPA: hypothetical protein [Caudoviricetes sp.]